MAGRYYFAALRFLLDPEQTLMAFAGRNRRPPRDPFNAALSFGYSLLYRDLMAAILCVGLDPALGFFHTPRSAAYPLALDLMELFRTTLWDMPLIASVNRRQWNQAHFSITHEQVWLSADGRKLAIGIYEERKQERWRHPVLRYSGTHSAMLGPWSSRSVCWRKNGAVPPVCSPDCGCADEPRRRTCRKALVSGLL